MEVEAAIHAEDGNVTRAAERLGISLRQMHRWVKDPRLSRVKRIGPGNPSLSDSDSVSRQVDDFWTALRKGKDK